MGSVRGHSVFLSPDSPESCTLSRPTTMSLSEFRIYSDFSLHVPPFHPGTRRDDLNRPLTSGESSESVPIFDRCQPDQALRTCRSELKACQRSPVPRQCPHEGSSPRPDMGILSRSRMFPSLIQELARNQRLAWNLQSLCTRVRTRFARVQSAVRPQPKFQVEE